MKKMIPILSFLVVLASSPAPEARGAEQNRERIDLGGCWQSTLGTCRLPGTTDGNRPGPDCTDTTSMNGLTLRYPFAGKVIRSFPPVSLHLPIRTVHPRKRSF